MTVYKALQPRDDVERLDALRKKGEEDLSAYKEELMHRYNDLKTT